MREKFEDLFLIKYLIRFYVDIFHRSSINFNIRVNNNCIIGCEKSEDLFCIIKYLIRF